MLQRSALPAATEAAAVSVTRAFSQRSSVGRSPLAPLPSSSLGLGLRLGQTKFAPGHLRRSLFIQTMDTPNPSSLKFVPGRDVLGEEYGTGMQVSSYRDAQGKSALAAQLFQVEGVDSVFLGNDFVTVNINEDMTSWKYAKPLV